VPGWEIAVFFKAAREVSGDFYDAFRLPDGNLAFVIGDVCDKGVGAALFMTLFRSLIRATATSDLSFTGKDMKALSPALRLEHVIPFTNAYITENHGEANMFATIFIGILDLSENRLTYINCGNEPPLILRKGSLLASLAPTGPVVGVVPGARFAVKEIVLEKDDLLLAFTDGIPDSKNAENDFFGGARLAEALEGCDTNPAALLGMIESRLEQFIGTAKQFDDITLLAIKRDS
jgi:sigma-B regulation protein RsbU (phosphoserine phosphatase)